MKGPRIGLKGRTSLPLYSRWRFTGVWCPQLSSGEIPLGPVSRFSRVSIDFLASRRRRICDSEAVLAGFSAVAYS